MTSWRSAVRVSYIPLSLHTLLAVAVLEVFPDAQVRGGGEESIGFYRDFEFSQEFRPEYLPLIEERMKKISKSSPELRTFEMVPQSARAMLEKQGQPWLADSLPHGKGVLIQLCQLGRFVDVITSQIKAEAFELTEFQLLENGATRIFGFSAKNAQDLQVFSKKVKKYSKANHQVLGEDLKLFSVKEGWCFYPRGVQLRKKILNTWSQQCIEAGFQEILPSKDFTAPLPLVQTAQLIQESADIREGEKRFLGLFAPRHYWADRLYLGRLDLDSLISSLQFARKFSTIFGFDPQWVLAKRSPPLLKQAILKCGWPFSEERNGNPGVEWYLRDGLGRRWKAGELSLEKEGITLSLFYALERFIALLLEKNGGSLPSWLESDG